MIPPKAPASTTLRNARTYALRDGSPAGTSESPASAESSPPPLLVGSSSISGIVRRSTARQPCACHTEHMAEPVREWLVAGALVESDGRLLFVRNQRRGGSEDWSTPGGVIDADHGSLLDGLTREVEEETGLRVTRWEGPLYEVEAVAPDLGWVMRCEVHRAVDFEGEVQVADPDGIVVEAAFVTTADAAAMIERCHPWVGEPIAEWLAEQWGPDSVRRYSYEVRGTTRADCAGTRTDRNGAVRD